MKTVNEWLEEGFWPYVLKDLRGDGCWVWAGRKNKAGYGYLTRLPRFWSRIPNPWGVKGAHCVSWRLHTSNKPKTFEIPNINQFILHKCNVRDCVNPDHLYLGTPADNVRDMIRAREMKKAGLQAL